MFIKLFSLWGLLTAPYNVIIVELITFFNQKKKKKINPFNISVFLTEIILSLFLCYPTLQVRAMFAHLRTTTRK